MSHHKRRVYPSQQFIVSNGNPSYEDDQSNLPFMPIPTSPRLSTDPGGLYSPVTLHTPKPMIPMTVNQQLDYMTSDLRNLQIRQDGASQSNVYGSPRNYSYSLDYGTVPKGKPMNHLYPIDLMAELPPPIHDLTLPPPPLLIPQQLSLVPSEYSNSSPDYIRCTLNAVPKNHTLLKKSKLPFALVVRPYQNLNDDEDSVPLSDDGLVLRCRRCRAYINPYVTFIDQSRRWKCNFCRLANDCPYQIDRGLNNSISSRYERPELSNAIIDYLAPKEYSLRQPPPSVYLFILDVSSKAMKNGFLVTVVATIIESLDSIPNRDHRTQVGVLCVDKQIHYFSVPLDIDSDKISMMDIGDLDEPFIPQASKIVVHLASCINNLKNVLKTIPDLFMHNNSTYFALGPALRSASKLIEHIGGKIILFSSTLPNIGIGRLRNRLDGNVTKDVTELLSCQDSFYKSFTVDCSKFQITIDSFIASNHYMDIASISNLARYTGGQTHFYPGFSASKLADVSKVTKEISKHLSMDLNLETVVRVRSSVGIISNTFYGHFFNRSSDLCAFSTMPRDQSYLFELSLEETLVTEYCYFQVAILFSENTGERKIRVMTLALPTTDALEDLYASADQLSMVTYFTQKCVEKALTKSLDDSREFAVRSLQEMLLVYKRDIAKNNNITTNSLKFCANLRMFPLLINSLLKHIAFRSGIVPIDHRAIALNQLESAPIPHLIKLLYPTIYSLHDIPDGVGYPNDEGYVVLPSILNASTTLIERYGLYLIDNDNELFLWIGGDAVVELIQDLFGISDIYSIPLGKQELPILENSDFNVRIRNIIEKLRECNDMITYKSLYIVRGPSLNEPVTSTTSREIATLRLWASSALVEDRILNNEGYREFLQNLRIRISR
ncbi:hypothetical protein Kpol_1039p29 [Vanderwaltozyma polyspora DSM 70294]|uniref:Protein transport protein SEC24 n=1 Tax=Vanderwaltozyma polyspora (strain ATCC 22028 / DSM 70294 / BCRC 21397 / CBS 2163 / NBRC 10782 / NRRL Y-8283 / UCD 57-17) TaxID=436907 RepID=A7THF6_VANPO|nr:uncharacterized protein Kpol_1039p29 [Vanderwaltozyma polyspora DSM 70294]EDO18280.1 hypothetical protein Kpol_1039p29 [Vanderwaltozyma polyspora DSM 70294]